MVDNVVANSGSGGATFATDDIGGTHYPRSKVVWGPDGTANDADVASGKALPIQIRTPLGDSAMDDTADAVKIIGQANSGVDIGDVDILSVVPGAGATNLGKAEDAVHATGDVGVMALGVRQAADTPLSGADGDYEPLQLDANGHLKVEVFDGGDSHTVDGTVTANAGSGTFTVDNAGTFAVQEDGAALTALQLIDDVVATDDTTVHATGATKGVNIMAAATPTDGSVAANDIGQVAMSLDRRLHVDSQIVGQDADVTIADGGNAITVDWAGTAPPIGAGTEAAALRVTVATDSTGVVSIDDNGGIITVDGTVTADLSATDNAVLDNIQTAVELIDNAISGTEMQVDVVAALPAGSGLVGDVGLSGARTSGGTTLYKNIDVDESEDAVKATAGQVYWLHAINLTASVVYLKFYNATVATVVVGTTVPDLTFPVPTQGDTNGAGFTLSIPNGIAFGTAITIAATTGVADADSGAPAANALVVNLGYA